jgi:hypothetical protein
VGYFALYSFEKYSQRKGYGNIVIEFEFIKKLTIVSTSLLVISIIFLFILPNYFEKNILDYLSEVVGYSGPVPLSFFFILASGPIMYVAITAFLRILTLIAKKDFRFYYAKGCCELISKSGDDVQTMKYLSLLFDSYNRYIRRHTKFQIKDINEIYSFIMYEDKEERQKIMNSICNSLEDNRLELPRLLATICKIPGNDLFVKESLIQRLKVIASLFAAAIPIFISIIEIMPKIIPSIFETFKF